MALLDCLSTLFAGAWNVITSVEFPGTGMSIAVILVGTLSAVVSLRIVGYIINVRYDISTARGAVDKVHGAHLERVRHSRKVGF